MKAINLVGMMLVAALSFSGAALAFGGERGDHSHSGDHGDHDKSLGERNFSQDLRGKPDATAISLKHVRNGKPGWKYREDSVRGEEGRDHR